MFSRRGKRIPLRLDRLSQSTKRYFFPAALITMACLNLRITYLHIRFPDRVWLLTKAEFSRPASDLMCRAKKEPEGYLNAMVS